MMNVMRMVFLSVLIECVWDPPCVTLFSFTRVNVFLLIVYLERPENASYECMKSEDGSDII